jgi:endonuclease-8
MPEGPECHIIAYRLGNMLRGHQLVQVDVLATDIPTAPPFNSALAARPATATQVAAKGKLIYATFDNGFTMLSTLGLQGNWSTSGGSHTRLAIRIRDQFHNEKRIFYCDALNYGTLKFIRTDPQLRNKLNLLGPDVVTASQAPDGYGECTLAWWLDLCKKKGEWTFPKLLMKQNYLAGLGNYLKAEALYQSRNSPLLLIKDFSLERQQAVLDAVLDVVRRSYGWKAHQAKMPGHSAPVPQYRHRVYNQGVDPEGNRVERAKTDDGRTTHWVPAMQEGRGGDVDVPKPGFEEFMVVARQLMRAGPPFPQWLDQDLKDDSKMAEDACPQKDPKQVELTLPPAKTA